MVTDKQTPDGYYVDVNGVWDGQPTTITVDTESLGQEPYRIPNRKKPDSSVKRFLLYGNEHRISG